MSVRGGGSPIELREAFGLELRELRRAAAMSQEHLATQTLLHPTYISSLERGLKTPTLEVVFRLAVALGVTPEEFIARVRDRMSN